jgi:L-threonylcarbamoyladenylate synthase
MIPKLNPFDASEGIYGIGCDPFNKSSVENIFDIKGRDLTKNFIILASNIKYLKRIIDNNLFKNKALIDGSFTTWVVPTNKDCPLWLSTNKSIAIRITNHPVVDELCENIGGPVISTSANCSNQKYTDNITAIENIFDGKIDCIVKGQLGNEKKSSMIKDILTNKILRY